MRLLRYIDTVNEWVGRLFSLILLVIMVFAVYEVVMRYFFSRPTIWVWEINSQLLCFAGAFAGAYALLTNTHVSVDIVSKRFSPRVRSIVNLITCPLFFIFVGSVVWFGGEEAWRSFAAKEREISTFASPLYIVKWMIPIGAALMLLQGIARFIREAASLKGNP